ncbi:MAG: hypothetical protein WBL21_05490, partial [Salinimicrobium sp.]
PKEMVEVINMDSFLISLLGNYGEAGFIKNIMPSFYRRHTAGIWSGKMKESKSISKILTYKKLEEFYKQDNDLSMVRHFTSLIKNINKSLFLIYLKKNQPLKAFRLLKTIL